MVSTLRILILITIIISSVSIICISYYSKKKNRPFLVKLLPVVLFLNSVWYSGLLLQYSSDLGFIAGDEKRVLIAELFFSTLLFCFRFLLLISFLRFLDELLAFRFQKHILPSLKAAIILTLSLWILGLSEVILTGSRKIATNLMLYTDIIVFVSIIAGCIYLYSQSKYISDRHIQRGIKFLSIIFIAPFLLACLKWIIGTSLAPSGSLERYLLHSFVLLFNILIIWWVIWQGQHIGQSVAFIKRGFNQDFAELISRYNITNRETDVILLICEGKTNQEIAGKLFISIDTVKDHNQNIFQKTGVSNRTQLANLFMQ